ncbi:metallophosphoesterase family protein [Dickeya lacustris]|uniref:Metallophosphoesterase n=1 Tax=Dickeya lacustris TaxID=2259638 RepID=A0ABY8G9C7_9GAMM|nr:metallophosphoesterase [Dickeya lacustris]WFN56584.1 metallophosphoesterase [Dickeya lacustris]
MKRRTFIKSAAFLSVANALPAMSKTTLSCTTEGESTANYQTSIVIVSDLHISNDKLLNEFESALQNMTQHHNINAIIIPGDIGEDLNFIEKTVSATIRYFNNKKAIVILGNHDVRGPDSDTWVKDPKASNPYYKHVMEKYVQLNAQWVKHVPGHACFDEWIDGHHFIALNTDRGLKDQAFFDKNTLKWLEEKLNENTQGKKKFVIVHQSLDDTHWRANLFGGFGEQDKKIKGILSRHPDTFIISGHIHNGFGVLEAIQRTYGTLVETPSFNRTENGLIEKGYGFIMRIGDDTVLFEAWNFLKNKHYPEYDIRIDNQTVNYLLKEKTDECINNALSEEYPWAEIAKKNNGGDDITESQAHFGLRQLWPTYQWDFYKRKAIE